MSIQRVRSKWAKTKVLLKAEDLRPHIPLTKRFSRDALQDMLSKYEMVYVKPISGTYGKGVVRVERNAEASPEYRYQLGTEAKTASSFDELYNGLLKIVGSKGYLIQKGIYLLKHRKRRFDLRVMVQKSPQGAWESTGIIGRLSHPKKIVTNYHNGGTVMTYEQLMSSHLSSSEMSAYRKRLQRLGAQVGKQLATAYPGLKELGVDIAIDAKLNPWVLEVNTKPHPYIFKRLSDKSIHRKIMRYARAYGGVKSKRS